MRRSGYDPVVEPGRRGAVPTPSRGGWVLDHMSLVTGLAAGVSIEAAVSHGLAGLSRRPRDGTRLAFAAAAAAVAVGAIAVVTMYSADSAQAHAALMKWLLYPASTVWTVAVVWLVAFYTGVRPQRFLLALTAAFGLMLVVDLALPLGLLHDQVGTLRPLDMAGAHAMGITGASPHPLHLITVALTVVALAFLLYALVRVYERGERGKAALLAAAVTLFAVSMLVDILTDYGLITSFYTTQLYFAGVVLVTSVALRRESLRDEAELRRYRTELESLVEARVVDLDQANEQLAEEVRVRVSTEDALRRRVAELDALQRLAQTLAERADLASVLKGAVGQIETLFSASFVTMRLAHLGDPGGRSPAITDGANISGGLVSVDPFGESPVLRRAIETRETIVVDSAHAELPPDLGESAAGKHAHQLLIVPMVARAGAVGVLVIARGADHTSFSPAETKLAQTVADALAVAVENERLHEQDARQAAVRERQRLARELHDAVTQTIYSATLIADALPEVWRREPDEGLRNLATLRRLVHGALAEMRTLLFELRPGALRAAPLDTLLERLGAALSGQIQVPVEVTVEEEVPVPTDVKVALYRVAQEAFSNIAKHARAGAVSASVVADAGGATMIVRDDGRGFDLSAVSPERMGLRIMRERLDEIGASIAVDSVPGGGTMIVVAWRRAAGDDVPGGEEGRRERLEAHSSDDRG